MKIVTAAQMRRIDQRTIQEYGIPGMVLMENAGAAVARFLEATYGPLKGERVGILCGKGNNGGDGLVVARYLRNWGAHPQVYLMAKREEVRGDARNQLEIYLRMGGAVLEPAQWSSVRLRRDLLHCRVVVDALLGTGLQSAVSGRYAEAIEQIQKIYEAGRPVVAVDIPSGIDSDTGAVQGCAVRAHHTLTMGLPKRGHFLFPGAAHRGALHIVDIGIPPEAVEEEGVSLEWLQEESLRAWLPPRALDTHKGTYGHVLVVAGSVGKTGAATLAARGALRAGAGLVTLAAPQEAARILAPQTPEVMTVPLPQTLLGTLSKEALEPLQALCQGKSILAMGPGVGRDPETIETLRSLLETVPLPAVVDADALLALAPPHPPLKRRAPWILTPHPGEMGVLQGCTAREIQQRRLESAQEMAQSLQAWVVLKGAHTVVASPRGALWINTTGNPGMATGGCGDVLTGILAGLWAQGLSPEQTILLGVYLHGKAGDEAAARRGEVSLIAGDLLECLPDAIRSLQPPGSVHP